MKKFVHGGNIYSEKAPFGEWLDFSANINPLGMSDTVRQAICDNIAGLVNYPDPYGCELKNAIAEFYNVSRENVVLGNGAVELLYVYCNSFRPMNMLLPVPSFSEYERAAEAAGTEIVRLLLGSQDSFSLNIDDIITRLAFFDCLILGNPNNPTGKMIKHDDIEKLIKLSAKTGAMVIVDESFIDFCSDGAEYSVKDLITKYNNLLVLQSMTKFYAIPGLRLGFALAAKEMVLRLEKGKDPWNVNLLAQKAGVAALSDVDYQLKSRELVENERQYLTSELATIKGINVFAPSVNFILLDIRETGFTSTELTMKMKEKGILIRNCDNYPGLDGGYIRTAIKTRESNCKLITALKECVLT